MVALFDLANEDLVAGDCGSAISSNPAGKFRITIERLIGTGAKADLSIDQTAVFFGQEVAVIFSSPVPILLQGVNRGIDALNLFRGVAATKAVAGASVVDSSYLSALQVESTTMASAPTTQSVITKTDEPTTEARDPDIQA